MTFVLKEQRFCNVGYLETFRYSVLILLVKLLNWWVEWGSKWHNIYLKIHHWIHEHMKSYNVAIKKTYLALFLFKGLYKKVWAFFVLKLTWTAILSKGLNMPCLNLHLNHVWSRFSGCSIIIVIFHQDIFIHVILTAWMFI